MRLVELGLEVLLLLVQCRLHLVAGDADVQNDQLHVGRGSALYVLA